LNLDLFLHAMNVISNAGSIVSSGNLTLQSATGHITNSGLLQSIAGNVNILGGNDGSLQFNNTAGQVLASNGAFDVSSINSVRPSIMNIVGGVIDAQSINGESQRGTLNIDVKELLGTLNLNVYNSHVRSQNGNGALTLGKINIAHDPTFYNTGDINNTGDIQVGETLTILAGGNITTGSGVNVIRARDAGGQGYDINIVAGAALSSSGTTSADPSSGGASNAAVTLDPMHPMGGNIDFSASPNVLIDASSGANKTGGNVTLAAFAAGSSGMGGMGGGNGMITLPQTSEIRTTGGAGNGNVSIIAGSASGTLQTGKITAGNMTGTTGRVSLYTAQPTLSDGMPITFDTAGNITSGNSIVASKTLTGGAISITGNIIADEQIVAKAGSNIQTPTTQIGTVQNVGLGSDQSPQHIVLDTNSTMSYMADYANNQVLAIDLQTQQITATLPANSPAGVFLNPTGTRLYVMDNTNNQLIVYNTTNNQLVGTIPLSGMNPHMGVFTKDGSSLYVLNADSNQISIIDPNGAGGVGRETGIISVTGGGMGGGMSGNYSNWITLNSTGSMAYVGYYDPMNTSSGHVAAIDLGMGMKMGTINLTFNPSSIAVTSRNQLYVGSANSNLLSVFSLPTLAAVQSIRVPAATEITLSPNGMLAYVSNLSGAVQGSGAGMGGMTMGSASIAVINTTNNKVIQTINIPNSEVHGISMAFEGPNLETVIHDHMNQQLVVLQIPALITPTLTLTSLKGSINVLTTAQMVTAFTGTGEVSIFSSGMNVAPVIDIVAMDMNMNLSNTLSTVQAGAIASSMGDKLGAMPMTLADSTAKKTSSEDDSEDDSFTSLQDAQKNLVLFTTANHVMSAAFATDDSPMILADEGAMVSDNAGVVVLHKGKVLADTGDTGVVVQTEQGKLEVAADSSLVINADGNKTVRFTAVGGSGKESTLTMNDGTKLSLKAGEEVVISDPATADEELIPVDGVERIEISAGISRHDVKVKKSVIALSQYHDKEIMIAGHLVRLASPVRKKRAQEHMNLAAHDQQAGGQFKDAGGRMAHNLVAATDRKLDIGTRDPLRLITSKGALLTQDQPWIIKIAKGEVFVVGNQDVSVHAGKAIVKGEKDALFSVKTADGMTIVKSCTGPGEVFVTVGSKTVKLSMGQEAVVLRNGKSLSDLNDGIGRRAPHTYQADQNTSLVVEEYSLPSYLLNSQELIKMSRSSDHDDREIIKRLMRSAVVINYALKHGPYSAAQ
jgi:DNA-binding beta-propeller fold protein YncE